MLSDKNKVFVGKSPWLVSILSVIMQLEMLILINIRINKCS